MKIGRMPALLSIAMTVAVGGSATLCATAQIPANAADPTAPTAATLTPEQIDAQWIAANSKYDAERKRGALSALVSDSLDEVLAARAAQSGRTVLDVVDVGAGTGGFAVHLAALGHRDTVVDPSPDALAAAQWRAAELGVTLTAVQGEAGDRRRFGGVGIGLFIVRRLAQAQHGEVTASSRPAGGTAMCLRLRPHEDPDVPLRP